MLPSSLDDLVCLLALLFLGFTIKNGRKLSYSHSKVKNKRYDNLLRKSCSHILFFQIQLSFVDLSLVLREHWRKFHNTINLMPMVRCTNYNHSSVTVYPIDWLRSNFFWRPPNCKQHFANTYVLTRYTPLQGTGTKSFTLGLLALHFRRLLGWFFGSVSTWCRAFIVVSFPLHNVYFVQYDAPVSFMTLYPIQ